VDTESNTSILEHTKHITCELCSWWDSGTKKKKDMPLSLPLLPETKNWSAEIQAAYKNIQHTYDHAIQVLRVDGADPVHIAFHVDAISSNALLILEALIPDGATVNLDDNLESLPVKWLDDVAAMLGCAVSDLEQLGTTVNEQEVIFFNRHINTEKGSYREEQNVDMLEFTRVANMGKRGCPKKIIDLDFLREATSSQHQIKHVELAKIVHVHQETL